jgi:DNA invertase Pin-like site-specific DNA recombinase
VFTVLGAIAEFERDMIRDRTRLGLKAAKARGKRLGRPRVPEPDASKVAALVAEGLGYEKVAKKLKISVWAARKAVGALQPEEPRVARVGRRGPTVGEGASDPRNAGADPKPA